MYLTEFHFSSKYRTAAIHRHMVQYTRRLSHFHSFQRQRTPLPPEKGKSNHRNLLSKYTDSSLIGQRHEALRLGAPLHVHSLDSPSQRLRPRLALLLVLADDNTSQTASCKELSGVVPSESCDRSTDIECDELVELTQIPDNGRGLVLVGGGEPSAVFGKGDGGDGGGRGCWECVCEL